jgi:hypothetical protein
VEKQRELLRFEITRQIRGHARQLYQYLSHVVHDPLLAENHVSAARNTAALMRSVARAQVAILGENYVQAMHNVTDNAMTLIRAREQSPGEALALDVRYKLGYPGDTHNAWFDMLIDASIPETQIEH